MIYEVILCVLVAVSLFSRAAQPFAWVLVATWFGTYAVELMGAPRLMPWVDVLAFNAMCLLTAKRCRWWSVSLCVLGAVTILAHVVAWSAYAIGIRVDLAYFHTLRATFMLSAIVLALGGFDVFQRVAHLLSSARRSSGGLSGLVGIGNRNGSSASEEQK